MRDIFRLGDPREIRDVQVNVISTHNGNMIFATGKLYHPGGKLVGAYTEVWPFTIPDSTSSDDYIKENMVVEHLTEKLNMRAQYPIPGDCDASYEISSHNSSTRSRA